MNSIKINKQSIKVQINDIGDTITINLGDQIFIRNFLELAEYGSKNKLNIGELDLTQKEDLDKVLNYSKGFAVLIDKAFGSGTTIKIFETTEPTPDLISQFVTQLEPFIKEASEQKEKAMQAQQSQFGGRIENRENSR